MKSREFHAQVANGKLPEATQKAISELLKGLEGKKVVLTVKEAQRPRSLSQNALLWAAIYPPVTKMFREAGNDVSDDETHEFCKEIVGKLKRVIVTPDGEVITIRGSTTRLTTSEMSDYIEKIYAFFSPYGVVWA